MGLLSQIVNDQTDIQAAEEYVSTGGSKKYEVSGNHIMKINMAKLKESMGGAIALSLELEDEDGIKMYEDIWFTNKEKKIYYIKQDGSKHELPGYGQVCGLNYLLTGVWGLPETEDKEIKEYSWERRKEEFVKREVAVQLIGKAIGVSVQVLLEDSYKDKTQPFTRVRAAHFFDPVTHLFASEKKAGKTEPELYNKFAEAAERTPVLDKREMSKGATTQTQSIAKESLAF